MRSSYNEINSVIDLGTNTCLLLIASLSGKDLKKLYEVQEIPRLGKGLYKSGNISQEKFHLVAEIFKNYTEISGKFNAKKIYAFGTSALRDANNSSEFIEFIKRETGTEIKVISGEDEAKYGFEGAVFDLPKKNYAVLDIGGGSTELSYMENGILNSESFNAGSVRLFENYFKEDFRTENLMKAKIFIHDVLSSDDFRNTNNSELVGVAGTLTTLSAIKNKLNYFDEEKIHKDRISLFEIEIIYEQLINMTNDERLSIGEFMAGRSEIIIPGILILTEIMKYKKFNSVTVSTKGLRYGLMKNIADFNK